MEKTGPAVGYEISSANQEKAGGVQLFHGQRDLACRMRVFLSPMRPEKLRVGPAYKRMSVLPPCVLPSIITRPSTSQAHLGDLKTRFYWLTPNGQITLDKMPSTQSSSQRRSSLKCPTLSHPTIRNVSLPIHPERHQRGHRVRFEGHRSGSDNNITNHIHSSPHSPGSRYRITRPRPSRIPCLVYSASLYGVAYRVRKDRSTTSEVCRPVEQHQTPIRCRPQLVERPQISASPLESARPSNRQKPSQKIPSDQQRLISAKLSPFIPSHSRAALSPCLSSPSKIDCSISSISLGGCEKLLHKIHRPVPIENQMQMKENMSPKVSRKEYHLSPSWCSPNIQHAAYKYKLPRSQNQRTDNEILSVFLKNNGGYLDDSDDEDEDEEELEGGGEEEPLDTVRATVAFLKKIPYPFEFRNPSRNTISSPQFNPDVSSSTISTRISSDSSPNLISRSSSSQYYWNRVHSTTTIVTPSKSGSRFTFYK
ncbi:hypothetical protein KEM48_013229 [Puccinia striiformis f. sp. tritici PST-130]|nr:hypothetical protein KEM48_013229 [Puccinia striiformis f. sp. tritici PST-130]